MTHEESKRSSGFSALHVAAFLAVQLAVATRPAQANDAALDRLLHAGRIQTELPVEREKPHPAAIGSRASVEPGEAPSPSRDRATRFHAEADAGPRSTAGAFDWLPSLDGFAKIALQVVLGCGFVVFLAWLATQVRERIAATAKSRERPVARTELRAPPMAPFEPIDDAATLASAGRFADAIHVLLLRAFVHCSRARGVVIPASSTSREVSRRFGEDAVVRAGLDRLVVAVEKGRFGRLPVDRIEYESCLAGYEALVAATRTSPRG